MEKLVSSGYEKILNLRFDFFRLLFLFLLLLFSSLALQLLISLLLLLLLCCFCCCLLAFVFVGANGFFAGAKSVCLFEANERKTTGRSVEVDVDRKLGRLPGASDLIAVLC